MPEIKPLIENQFQYQCGAIVLSGGLNTRMAGRNKAFLRVGGRSILERLLNCLKSKFEEILLVTRQPEVYADIPIRVVRDLYKDRSSLTGIHAGLKQSRAEYAFVVPCDTPFLLPAVIQLLIDTLTSDVDVVVPHVNGHYEPLCAIYSKRCIPFIETQLNRENYRIYDFFDLVNIKTLSTKQIASVDPDFISFFNVNTPEKHVFSHNLVQAIGGE
ncbi:putative molybdenum cofactor guanylyltransferase [Desulfosarcina ovata subsp. sediminis]|uniref:Probable molybdenum cofactor guanylyltransferase n=1 Tax=Desulfosarcina ovata subsp. sediminis TaxID=885957 RepID=A0A5K7ZJI6_9BACT|nr:putative molybdenum cofactor guanylyltransferase [Desulfosarcina ovata subsp. sediminis]